MSLGISTASLYPLETEKAFEMIAKSGADCTEIFFNCKYELTKDFVEILRGIKNEYGIKVSSIHPTMSLAESFMLFSAYDRRTKEGFDEFRRYAEIAADLKAKYIILHGGKPNKVLDDDRYIERFYKLSNAVKEHGAVLLQENVVNFRAGSTAFLKKFTESLKSDANICFDIKQAVRGGYNPIDTVKRFGRYIRHYHISDNSPESDCMLPLKGNFDFKGFYKAVEESGYKGDFMIEVYRDAYKEYGELFGSYFKLKKCRFANDAL